MEDKEYDELIKKVHEIHEGAGTRITSVAIAVLFIFAMTLMQYNEIHKLSKRIDDLSHTCDSSKSQKPEIK